MSMDWESWLREASLSPEEKKREVPQNIEEDKAVLLDLPLALVNLPKKRISSSESTNILENTQPLVQLPPEEETAHAAVEEDTKDASPELVVRSFVSGVTLEEEALVQKSPVIERDPDAFLEEPPAPFFQLTKEIIAEPSVCPEKEKKGKRERRRKRVLAVGVATAVAAGVYFFFGRDNFQELLSKGERLYGNGEYVQALSYYTRATEKEPMILDAFLGLARTLERLDRKGEAVDAYYRCLQMAPENPYVHARLGFLLYSLSSYENAIRSFQESVKFDPSNGEVFAGMGRTYEAKGDYAQAVFAYKKALEIDSTLSGVKEDFERAEKILSEKNEEAERNKRAVFSKEQVLLGRTALGLGDFQEGETHFLRALDLVPDDHDALMGLAEAKKASGDFAGAAVIYKAVLKIHPDSEQARSALQSLMAPSGKITNRKNRGNGENGGKKPNGTKTAPSSEVRKNGPAQKNNSLTANGMKGKKNLTPKPGKRPGQKIHMKEQPQAHSVASSVLLAAREGKIVLAVSPSSKKKNDASLLTASKTLNEAGEFAEAVEKASAALLLSHAPEALSNLGYAYLGLKNYSSAFSAFWRRILLSPAQSAGESFEPPVFGGVPFQGKQWKDFSPVADESLPRGLPFSIPLPEFSGEVPSRFLFNKTALLEAMDLNPQECSLYMNLAMSYIFLKKEEEKKRGNLLVPTMERYNEEGEEALYLSLLAHAFFRRGETEKAFFFLDAAKERAREEILRFVLSLEYFLGENVEKNRKIAF